jgi:hypothetical protein
MKQAKSLSYADKCVAMIVKFWSATSPFGRIESCRLFGHSNTPNGAASGHLKLFELGALFWITFKFTKLV